jgi:predicted MFS family arabinose efflux permease
VAPGARQGVSLGALLGRPEVRSACLVQCVNQLSAFLILPHFAAWFVLNLGFPRERLGSLYALGGVAALVTANLLGRLADRVGPVPAVLVATCGVGAGLLPFLELRALEGGVLAALFVAFMAGNAGRNVSVAAALSQVPGPHERGAFMALQNLVQDGAIALGALAGWCLLTSDEAGRLGGMPLLAGVAGLLALLAPMVLAWHTKPAASGSSSPV